MKYLILFLSAALLAGCLESGPKKTLNEMADAMIKKDSAAFMAKLDMPRYSAACMDNFTKEDKTLNALDSLGKMFGVGGVSDLVNNIVDVQKQLTSELTRGVATGELQLECRKSERPDCPFTPEALKAAEIKELGPDTAIARVTVPSGIASWLSLAKSKNVWLVVGQAATESQATQYAKTPLQTAPAAPATPPAQPKDKPAPPQSI